MLTLFSFLVIAINQEPHLSLPSQPVMSFLVVARTAASSVLRSCARPRATTAANQMAGRQFHCHDYPTTTMPSSHHSAFQTAAESSSSAEEVPVFAFYGLWGSLLGANALAIWCEMQMTPQESLLQSVAAPTTPPAESQPAWTQQEEYCVPHFSRNTSKFRISIKFHHDS